MLRGQYAQELLQTFSTTIGEVSLIPTSGGIFTITLYHASSPPTTLTTAVGSNASPTIDSELTTASIATRTEEVSIIQETCIWDRKAEGGFPETKELKSRVRNLIQPGRDLGHVDRSLKKSKEEKGGKGGEEDVGNKEVDGKSKEEVVAEESARERMEEKRGKQGEGEASGRMGDEACNDCS